MWLSLLPTNSPSTRTGQRAEQIHVRRKRLNTHAQQCQACAERLIDRLMIIGALLSRARRIRLRDDHDSDNARSTAARSPAQRDTFAQEKGQSRQQQQRGPGAQNQVKHAIGNCAERARQQRPAPTPARPSPRVGSFADVSSMPSTGAEKRPHSKSRARRARTD